MAFQLPPLDFLNNAERPGKSAGNFFETQKNALIYMEKNGFPTFEDRLAKADSLSHKPRPEHGAGRQAAVAAQESPNQNTEQNRNVNASEKGNEQAVAEATAGGATETDADTGETLPGGKQDTQSDGDDAAGLAAEPSTFGEEGADPADEKATGLAAELLTFGEEGADPADEKGAEPVGEKVVEPVGEKGAEPTGEETPAETLIDGVVSLTAQTVAEDEVLTTPAKAGGEIHSQANNDGSDSNVDNGLLQAEVEITVVEGQIGVRQPSINNNDGLAASAVELKPNNPAGNPVKPAFTGQGKQEGGSQSDLSKSFFQLTDGEGKAGNDPAKPETLRSASLDNISQVKQGAGLPAGMVLTGRPAVAMTSPYVTNLQMPVQTPAWQTGLAQKLVWFVSEKIQTAKIHVNPPELGPVEMKIQVVREQAQIQVQSPHAVVRDLLEGTAQRLRDMLADQGIELTDFDVGSQEQTMTEGDESSQEEYATEAAAGENLVAETQAGAESLELDQLIDYYV